MQPNEPERGSLPGLTNHSSDQYGAGLYCVRKQPLSAPRQSWLNPPRGPVLDYHVCSAHNHCIMEIRQDWLRQGKKIGRGPRALKPSRHPCVVLKTVIIPVISSRLVGVQSIGDNHLLTQTQSVMAEVTWPSNNSPIQICVVSRLKLAQKCMTDSFLIQLSVCLSVLRGEELGVHARYWLAASSRVPWMPQNLIEATLFAHGRAKKPA